MALQINLLKEVAAPNSDLIDFMQWAQEWDIHDKFAMHYVLRDSGELIVDFCMLKSELDDHFDNVMGNPDDETRPDPPDIRAWLDSMIESGVYLGWVSW